MDPLTIRIKKKSDGTAALTCTRSDGTVTWQRQEGAQGAFFPPHDLTHYAVETVLAHRRGFYGLVAEGWDFEDFGTPWPRGPMPADSDPSELIVGFLDGERSCGCRWSAAEFKEKTEMFFAANGIEAAAPPVTDAQLDAIRDRMRELFALWDGVVPGEALVLTFRPGSQKMEVE